MSLWFVEKSHRVQNPGRATCPGGDAICVVLIFGPSRSRRLLLCAREQNSNGRLLASRHRRAKELRFRAVMMCCSAEAVMIRSPVMGCITHHHEMDGTSIFVRYNAETSCRCSRLGPARRREEVFILLLSACDITSIR